MVIGRRLSKVCVWLPDGIRVYVYFIGYPPMPVDLFIPMLYIGLPTSLSRFRSKVTVIRVACGTLELEKIIGSYGADDELAGVDDEEVVYSRSLLASTNPLVSSFVILIEYVVPGRRL
jgi:hypothetical protein